jgi:hypothetical protein
MHLCPPLLPLAFPTTLMPTLTEMPMLAVMRMERMDRVRVLPAGRWKPSVKLSLAHPIEEDKIPWLAPLLAVRVDDRVYIPGMPECH